jgi:hypothetical protein
MAKRNGRTAKQYAEAITEARGFISVAARHLGVSRTQVYRMIDKHPSVAEAVADARESMTDLAEGKLVKLINDENATAIIFYLKTQGKGRGYVERQELTGKDGGAIETKETGMTDDERLARLAAILDTIRDRRDRESD